MSGSQKHIDSTDHDRGRDSATYPRLRWPDSEAHSRQSSAARSPSSSENLALASPASTETSFRVLRPNVIVLGEMQGNLIARRKAIIEFTFAGHEILDGMEHQQLRSSKARASRSRMSFCLKPASTSTMCRCGRSSGRNCCGRARRRRR